MLTASMAASVVLWYSSFWRLGPPGPSGSVMELRFFRGRGAHCRRRRSASRSAALGLRWWLDRKGRSLVGLSGRGGAGSAPPPSLLPQNPLSTSFPSHCCPPPAGRTGLLYAGGGDGLLISHFLFVFCKTFYVVPLVCEETSQPISFGCDIRCDITSALAPWQRPLALSPLVGRVHGVDGRCCHSLWL